ncbi:hypothetical protein GA0115255_114614 [Streptomyces sp. Ncost-T6T-2b]|nr:hypothetical protein GA0115255_114614 [Streptomyces sp. Ncost-T6T-2b]
MTTPGMNRELQLGGPEQDAAPARCGQEPAGTSVGISKNEPANSLI